MSSPDVMVIGLGGMGTAAAWRLAQRGAKVLGLERYGIGHDRGSSHGHTRIIRQAYYEHPAGFLYVDRCVEAMAAEARRCGAVLRAGESVVGWEPASGGFVVQTAAGRYFAPRLVITAGPWAGELLGGLGAPLRVMRQVV